MEDFLGIRDLNEEKLVLSPLIEISQKYRGSYKERPATPHRQQVAKAAAGKFLWYFLSWDGGLETMRLGSIASSITSIWFPCRRRRLSFLSPQLVSLSPSPFPSAGGVNSKNRRIMLQSISTSFSPLTPVASSELPSVEVKKQHPWLVVGLGNPGKRYQGTRHNVGFELLDAIAEAEGIPVKSVNFKSLFGKGFIGSVPVILAKPQTFMNVSGESVAPIVSYYKIPLNQVIVLYDDLDLPLAKLRLLPKGGHGGHNGMRSIIDRFKGSRDFPRLRIGIGRPPGKMDAANFVLASFNRSEREELDFALQRGVEAVRILVLEGFNKSATFVNTTKSMEQLS
ncbi:hypothetical protein SAY86_004149 [Trapa natans]|uniref:peptidyl-tRNA hydrolase n=1 Tax=Trapa natans TaxID=22666 RepID=A0AAN7RHN1_TRANT|nr:hypothetical protein SAY86_004149 [Trapa natans]